MWMNSIFDTYFWIKNSVVSYTFFVNRGSILLRFPSFFLLSTALFRLRLSFLLSFELLQHAIVTVFSKIQYSINTKFVEHCTLFFGVYIAHFVILDEQSMRWATACPQGTMALRRKLRETYLQSNREKDIVGISILTVSYDCRRLSYPYAMPGAQKGPATLRNRFTAPFYVWNNRMMLGMEAMTDAKSPGSHEDVGDHIDDDAVSEGIWLHKEHQSDVGIMRFNNRLNAVAIEDVKIDNKNAADIE